MNQLGQEKLDALTLQKNMYYKKDRKMEVIKAKKLLLNLQKTKKIS